MEEAEVEEEGGVDEERGGVPMTKGSGNVNRVLLARWRRKQTEADFLMLKASFH